MRGLCLCGEIEFEISGKVPNLYQCHCSLCRRQGGSLSNAATIIDALALHWICGRSSVASWTKSTGFRSDFCSKCGSPVPNPLRDKPYYWIPAGLLESPETLTIAVHLFVGSRASWDLTPLTGKAYDTMPTLSKLTSLLNAEPDA